MKKLLVLLIILGIGSAVGIFFWSRKLFLPGTPAISVGDGQPPLPTQSYRIGPDDVVILERATTAEQRRQGLSNRPPLAPDTGMLFLFDHPDRYSFWMKDMRFALDILYLNNNVIQEVFADVPFPATGTLPATVYPTLPADAVLEVLAGESARHGWGPGVTVLPVLDTNTQKLPINSQK